MLKGKNNKFSCKYDIRVGLNGDTSQDRVIDGNLDKEFLVLIDNKTGDLRETMPSADENDLVGN